MEIKAGHHWPNMLKATLTLKLFANGRKKDGRINQINTPGALPNEFNMHLAIRKNQAGRNPSSTGNQPSLLA